MRARKGHRHAYDVVQRIAVDHLEGAHLVKGGRIVRRWIRIRQCVCGEVGYEVPA